MHDNQLCYLCGDALCGGTVMPHTFWSCPHKKAEIEEVEARLTARDHEQGASAQRDRNSQSQANARRAAQYDDTVDNQTFERKPPCGHSRDAWNEPAQEPDHGQGQGLPTRYDPRPPANG